MEFVLLILLALAIPALGVIGFFRTLSLARRIETLERGLAALEARSTFSASEGPQTLPAQPPAAEPEAAPAVEPEAAPAAEPEGEAAPETVVQQELTTLSVEADAANIPTSVVANVEGLTAGSHVAASQVTLPEGTTLAGDPEQLVVVITAVATAAQAEAELEALEAEAGIVKEEHTPVEGEEA